MSNNPAVPYHLKPKATKLPSGHDDSLDPPVSPTDAERRGVPLIFWEAMDKSKGGTAPPDAPLAPPATDPATRGLPPFAWPRMGLSNRALRETGLWVGDLDPDIAMWPITPLQRWPFAGSPAEGIWPKGWLGVDSNSLVWVCTVGGEPGTWAQVGGGGGGGTSTVLNPVAVASFYDTEVTSSPPSGAATVDTHPVVTGDRVLLTAQTVAHDNGIWVANAAGAWSRPTDWANGAVIPNGTMVVVEDLIGEFFYSSIWQVKTACTVGTTNVQFVLQVSPGGLQLGVGTAPGEFPHSKAEGQFFAGVGLEFAGWPVGGGSNDVHRFYCFAGNPNGSVTSGDEGDLCIDNVTPALWIATGNGTTTWDLVGPGADTGWIDATPLLVNSWTVTPGAPCRYRKLNGVVHLNFWVTGGSAMTVFTLPAGFRPAVNADQFCVVVQNSGTLLAGICAITTGGAVQLSLLSSPTPPTDVGALYVSFIADA